MIGGIPVPDIPADAYKMLVDLLEEMQYRESRNKILTYYPDEGLFRRELYVKHLRFFQAGVGYRERLFLAANRVGKTEGVGGYELVCHMTGRYPPWWEGRRYNRPVDCWAAGTTSKDVRDILQKKLLGPLDAMGTGLIPADTIVGKPRSKPGVPNAVENVAVRHSSGGISHLLFKSYDQGREAFQGTEQDVILLDEEPPYDIYTECLIRTMTLNGMIMCTFTPLLGLSETVMHFLPQGKMPSADNNDIDGKFVIMATWDDAPHLSETVKAELFKTLPPHQRDARTRGVPQLGAGAIYPVSETDIIVKPFDISKYPWFFYVYGMDVGWRRTAAVWGAHDRETDVVYIYSTHYRGEAEPPIHAAAVHSRGTWIPGVCDPAARGRNQVDGSRLLELYLDLGLDLLPADNAVETGIYEVWQRLSTGRLKVFSHLEDFLGEYRIYRRDEKGKIVKQNDHLVDALRYLILSGLHVAIQRPADHMLQKGYVEPSAYTVGKNSITGY